MSSRTLEWIGLNNAGETIARVVRIQGPFSTGWRSFSAVARDAEARIVDLRPRTPPDGADWLACVGGQVIARATLPMQAVRAVEDALEADSGPQAGQGVIA